MSDHAGAGTRGQRNFPGLFQLHQIEDDCFVFAPADGEGDAFEPARVDCRDVLGAGQGGDDFQGLGVDH